MHKDKWLLLAILCLIVGIIESYNLVKTVAKHQKAPASVSASAQKTENTAVKQQPASAQAKKNENKTAQKAANQAEKENKQQDSAKRQAQQENAAPVLPPDQGREPKSPKKAKAVLTKFTYTDPGAKEVTFHGSWSGKSYPMALKNGVWTFEARLNPAEYAYHFRVDGVKKINQDKPVNAAGDNVVKVLPAE